MVPTVHPSPYGLEQLYDLVLVVAVQQQLAQQLVGAQEVVDVLPRVVRAGVAGAPLHLHDTRYSTIM